MSGTILLLFCAFGVTLTRSVLVQAGFASPLCGRCGHPFERRQLGDPVCRCG
jgi:hypothetical protein